VSGYVFVGGLHRTGTSLVARCLSAHPEVAGFRDTSVWEDEGQHLQDVLPAARRLGGPGQFAFHPDAHLTEGSGLAVDETRQALLRAWEPLWGAGRWRLEKSPPNLLRGRLLLQLFPTARFLFTTRHPLAVALATRRMSASRRGMDLVELVRHWCVAHELLQEDLPVLEGRAVVLRLEEVARDPGHLVAGFNLLGLDAVPPPEVILPDPDARYHRAAAWRLRPHLRRRFVERLKTLEARVSACGYELFDFA
jgi:hypothetical protein